jgi:hypothetical protein
LARAISPGRGALAEAGTWRFFGFSIDVAPDEGVIGGGFLAEIPTNMIVA